jgi:hypothetical protein
MTNFCKALIFLLVSPLLFAGPNSPSPASGTENGIDLRVLKKHQRNIFVFETKNRNELLHQNYHQLMLGSYYRLTKKFRTGIFFQTEQGLRWDQDWRNSGDWDWGHISNRWDFSTTLDLTYQDKISSFFLWEWKNRLLYYHSRDAFLLKLRPGIRYFIFDKGKPWIQLYSQLETYSPINYGDHLLYEYWVYLGALFHLSKEVSLGPVFSYRQRWFHTYENFNDSTQESFREKFSSFYYGLNFLIQF